MSKSASILTGVASVLRRPMDEGKLIQRFPHFVRGSLHFDATHLKWACTIRCTCQCRCKATREVFVSDLFLVRPSTIHLWVRCEKCTPLPGIED